MSMYKYNIINSFPLLELEEQYAEIIKHSHSNGISLYDSALQVCPEIILGLSDEYMATLINKLSEKFTNIMVVCGYAPTSTIPYYMYQSPKANALKHLDKLSSNK